MELNVLELFNKLNMSQNAFAKNTGINRYSVNMIVNGHRDPDMIIPDSIYYDICRKYPEALSLPDDFFHYTRITLFLNVGIKNVPYKDIKITPRYIWSDEGIYASGMLYSYKEAFHAVFDPLYIPVIYDRTLGKIPLNIATATLPGDIQWPEIKPEAKQTDALYNVENFLVNLYCRNIIARNSLERAGLSEQFIKDLLSYDNQSSLLSHKDFLHEIFQPYFILSDI